MSSGGRDLLEFRILGPLEVVCAEEGLPFRGSRERALLALLVLNANRTVSAERLAEDLWNGNPPDGAIRSLRVYVSRLRQALGDAGQAVITRPSGYLLQVEPEAIDALRFEALVAQGRDLGREGNHVAAAATLREALALWRGPALADVAEAPLARAEASRLEEARLGALEDRIEADLGCGRHGELTGELEGLTREHPFRERLWSQRIVALYRAGRQADALRSYQDLRQNLADQLGLEPSETLRRLESAVLRHDPDIDWPPAHLPPGAAVSPPPAEAVPLPAPVRREERVPLVARAAEVARLEAAWQASAAGERRLVLLGGEPGVGKSRLMRDFARQVHEGGGLVLFGRCEEGMGVPYQPFVEALARYVRESPAPVLGHLAGELVRLVPEVADRSPGLPLPLRADPETERYRLFEAVASWLTAASAASPVLFVIDDLHWATKPTLLLLSHVAVSDELRSLLLVMAYRNTPLDVTGELADTIGELLRQRGVERMSLAGLDADGVAAFMEAQARHELDEDGWALARVLHAETAGNPFFVREVLRHLAEKGALVQEEGRWVTGQPLAEVDVPDSVRDVVGQRLTRLPHKTDEVLAIAAVLGERFELPVLAAAVGESPGDVLRLLEPALAARLVEETAIGRYHFAHALVRATLEDALGHTRRAQLHLRAAGAIESVFAGRLEGRAAGLAAHYQQAGSLAESERTVEALIQAGREASQALAWEEVADYWQAALDLMEPTEAAGARRADLLASLADLLFVAGFDLERSIQCAEKAVGLFEELGERQRAAGLRSRLGGYLTTNALHGVMDVPRGLRELHAAAEVLGDQPESLAYGYLQGSLGAAAGIWAAQPAEGLTASRHAMQIGEARGHEALWVMGAMLAGFNLLAMGSLAEGFALTERAWEVADRLDHRYLATRCVHIHMCWSVLLRDPDLTATWAERELSKRRLAHAPIQRHVIAGSLAWAHVMSGRLAAARDVGRTVRDLPIGVFRPSLEFWDAGWEDAEEVLLRAVAEHRDTGNRFDEARLNVWLGEIARLRGDDDRSQKFIDHALEITVPACHRVLEVDARAGLALLDAVRGRGAPAREGAAQARALLAGTEDWRGLSGRVELAEAAVRAGEGDLPAAGAGFTRAIEVFRRLSLPWDEAEARLHWGRSLARAGDPRALGHFDAALSIYDRCGAGRPWRERVQRARAGTS